VLCSFLLAAWRDFDAAQEAAWSDLLDEPD
jgi:hypothetical protein